jgi:hypothetical protein
MMPPVVFHMGRQRYRRAFNIGYWAWELSRLPAEWIKALQYVNAIFVPSEFANRAVSQHTRKPVMTVPHPVTLGPVDSGIRQSLGIPSDAFLVASVFTFESFGRKNPIGVVRAFQKAFRANSAAYLVLKASDGASHSDKVALLTSHFEGNPRILLVNDVWPSDRISGLIAAADAYISLHRSEGFGLTIVEAILRRIPVVVTGWSGNVDFCSQATYLVDAQMVPVRDVHPEFRSMDTSVWADASIEHAAVHLLEIHNDRQASRNRTLVAQQFATQHLNANDYSSALARLAEHG